jgi:hypothetical protein
MSGCKYIVRFDKTGKKAGYCNSDRFGGDYIICVTKTAIESYPRSPGEDGTGDASPSKANLAPPRKD